MNYISGRLSGEPGRRLLRMYYDVLARRESGMCLVARDNENGAVCGLTVILWTRRTLWAQIASRSPLKVAWWLSLNFLRDPAKIITLPRALWERWPVQNLRRRAGPVSWGGCILQTLISTVPHQGVGTALVSAARDSARERGFRYIFVPAVEANPAANRVYDKLGFQLLMTASELGKKVHWYGYRLDGEGEGAETLTAEESRTSRGPEPLSYADRLLRKTWVFVSFLLFRFSPAPLHVWRRFLLRAFGAKVGPGARIYPTVSVWAPWNLILGKDACLGYRVNCYNGGIVALEEGAMVSQDSTLCAATHDYNLSLHALGHPADHDW